MAGHPLALEFFRGLIAEDANEWFTVVKHSFAYRKLDDAGMPGAVPLLMPYQ
jgi:hypothetical protein